MISIPKKVEYSIIFISYLSQNKGKSISLTDASKRLMLPYRFLGQLASNLKSAGIIESKEGKTGGYNLAAGFENKTLFELVEALGENKHLVECLSDGKKCGREDVCQIAKVWVRIEDTIFSEMKKIKLGDI